MRNFLTFIMMSILVFFLAIFVLEWEDDPDAGLTDSDGKGNTYNWSDSFSFPQTLYSRVNYQPRAVGRVYYIDPETGSMENDGSREAPWSTLEDVFTAGLVQHYRYKDLPYKSGAERVLVNADAPVKSGDVLLLMTGDHGAIDVGKGGFYLGGDGFLTIKSGTGEEPVLNSINMYSAGNICLEGIGFECDVRKLKTGRGIVDFTGHKHTGEVENIVIRNSSVTSIGDHRRWSREEWKEKTASGIVISGSDAAVVGCRVKNVALGIAVTGDRSVVADNNVMNFTVDGLRGNGSDLLFLRNMVSDSYKVDDNHDDGFQSFLVGDRKLYRNVILQDNVFIQSLDNSSRYIGAFQGIGCFDGPYESWSITGNTVICDNWHGISILGAVDSVVSSNTVLPFSQFADQGPPWIAVIKSKSGVEPVRCIVEDNTAMEYRLSGSVEKINNKKISDEVEAAAEVKRFRDKVIKF